MARNSCELIGTSWSPRKKKPGTECRAWDGPRISRCRSAGAPTPGRLFCRNDVRPSSSASVSASSSPAARNSGNASGSAAGSPDRAQLIETKWFRQPSGPFEQSLGLPRHVAFLEVVDELHRLLALYLAHGLENARFGDPAEIVVDGRLPTHCCHVKSDGTGKNVGVIEPFGVCRSRRRGPHCSG